MKPDFSKIGSTKAVIEFIAKQILSEPKLYAQYDWNMGIKKQRPVKTSVRSRADAHD